MPPKTPTPQQSNQQQFEFDGLFEFGAAKKTLTVREVAAALTLSDAQVYAHLDEGNFIEFGIGDKRTGTSRQGVETTPREHKRIMRFSVVAWWREQLAVNGQEPPFYQAPEVLYWRTELRKKNGLLSPCSPCLRGESQPVPSVVKPQF